MASKVLVFDLSGYQFFGTLYNMCNVIDMKIIFQL